MTNNKQLLIYGAGGHAKVVLDCALSAGMKVAGFLDDDLSRKGELLNGFEILSGISDISAGSKHFVVAIGDNNMRKQRQQKLKAESFELVSVIHSTAVIGSLVAFGDGCQVLPRAVINANARIGHGVIVNTAVVIEHDCIVGDYCHIAPGSILLGECKVGDGSLIGAGSVVKPGLTIGNNVVVGAGSVVTKDIADNSVFMGIPARFAGNPRL